MADCLRITRIKGKGGVDREIGRTTHHHPAPEGLPVLSVAQFRAGVAYKAMRDEARCRVITGFKSTEECLCLGLILYGTNFSGQY